MAVVAVIQARMGSTRLPGKVLRPLAGRPMIGHVVERVRRAAAIDRVVVAIPSGPDDVPLADYLRAEGVEIVEGPADDVLARYRKAARETGAEAVVRITGDCPLISPSVTGRVVQAFLAADPPCDYASNTLVRTFPRGLDTEVISFAALETAHREATVPADREHVTPYVWRNPGRFRLVNVADAIDRHELRWTVDTADDLALATLVFETLHPSNPEFDYHDVLALLERHPEWAELNRGVRQKEYSG